jgi:mRNA-degrading endonuclease toxin of MazEF toxin-antitoxin module
MPAPVNSVMGMPPAPVSPVIASGVAPVTPVASVPEAQPAPTEQPAPTVQDNSDTPGTVTAVQSLAISNMAKMHGAQTEEEVLTMIINTDAAGLGRQIASLKDLSYNEAVKIIRTVKELQDKR